MWRYRALPGQAAEVGGARGGVRSSRDVIGLHGGVYEVVCEHRGEDEEEERADDRFVRLFVVCRAVVRYFYYLSAIILVYVNLSMYLSFLSRLSCLSSVFRLSVE